MNRSNEVAVENRGRHSIRLIAQVQDCVARAFELSRGELLSRRRTQRVARARQVAMYLCRDLARNPAAGRFGDGAWASFPRIARAFERDHSSVIHAYKAVAQRLITDSEFANMVDDLARDLRLRTYQAREEQHG